MKLGETDNPIGRFPIGIKTEIWYLIFLIILRGKIKTTTNNKISYFGFYFDWKSTSGYLIMELIGDLNRESGAELLVLFSNSRGNELKY